MVVVTREIFSFVLCSPLSMRLLLLSVNVRTTIVLERKGGGRESARAQGYFEGGKRRGEG